MKVSKRILVLCCCIILLLTCVVCATNYSLDNFKKNKHYDMVFVDIKNSDWFYENVKNAYEYELINGTTENTFSPNDDITIAEAVTIASRVYKIYYDDNYQFVSAEPWYVPYTDYAERNLIINKNQYSDYDTVATRAQFVTILSNALPKAEFSSINDVSIGDIPDVDASAEYSNSVYMLYNAGIISGNDKYGTFAPNNSIKRSEVATILTRMIDVKLRKQFYLEEEPLQLLYAEDGRQKAFKKSEVSAQLKVGWYTEPVQRLYTDDGRSKLFKKSEVAAQLTVGWYTEKPLSSIPWYEDNMYRIGIDIPAGDYYALATSSSGGYYCKYKDSTQDDIEDNDNFNNFTFFRCYNGQYLKLSRCKITAINNAPIYKANNGIYNEGTYRVGIDMPAGEYKFTSTDDIGGYYCVYTDITYDDIVDNDNFNGTAYYTVHNGQYLTIHRATVQNIKEINSITKDTPYNKLKNFIIEEGEYDSKESAYRISINNDVYSTKLDASGVILAFESNGCIYLYFNNITDTSCVSTIVKLSENDVAKGGVEFESFSTDKEIEIYGIFKNGIFTKTSGNEPANTTNSLMNIMNLSLKRFDLEFKNKGLDVSLSDFNISY